MLIGLKQMSIIDSKALNKSSLFKINKITQLRSTLVLILKVAFMAAKAAQIFLQMQELEF